MLRWFVLQWQFHLSEPYTNDIALLNRHSQSASQYLVRNWIQELHREPMEQD